MRDHAKVTLSLHIYIYVFFFPFLFFLFLHICKTLILLCDITFGVYILLCRTLGSFKLLIYY